MVQTPDKNMGQLPVNILFGALLSLLLTWPLKIRNGWLSAVFSIEFGENLTLAASVSETRPRQSDEAL